MTLINSNNLIEEFISNSEQETERKGSSLAKTLATETTLALHGDFGCGKTVFTRGIARGLGIELPITSPSFTIIQEYEHAHRMLYHLDLYRIDTEENALAFGIDEFINNKNAITVIEWADRIPNLLIGDCITIKFESVSLQQRVIRFYHKSVPSSLKSD